MYATDDWYEWARLAPGSYRIDEADGYGSFLVQGESRSVVIDAGTGIGDLRGFLAAALADEVTLVLTHTHWDHIGAAARFEDIRVGPPELPPDGRVTIDSLTDEFVDRPTQFATRWVEAGNELPTGVDPADHAIDPFDARPLPVDGGIEVGDRTLEMVPLPGHSPGHLGLLDPATGVLYGGDIIHFDRNLYLMFEDSDLEACIDSLARLQDLRDAGVFTVLATSHNEPLRGADLSLLDDLLAGLSEIAAGERSSERVETDWGPARSYQVGPSEVLTKPDR